MKAITAYSFRHCKDKSPTPSPNDKGSTQRNGAALPTCKREERHHKNVPSAPDRSKS